MDIEDFYLDEEKLADGCKMPLETVHGKPTEHWIRVRYIHSDEVQTAISAEYRRIFNQEGVDPDKLKEQIKELGNAQKGIRHLLVADWSFEKECSSENIKELFRRNPEIASSVVLRAENKRFFLPEPAENSSTGQKEKSNSPRNTATPKAKAVAA